MIARGYKAKHPRDFPDLTSLRLTMDVVPGHEANTHFLPATFIFKTTCPMQQGATDIVIINIAWTILWTKAKLLSC